LGKPGRLEAGDEDAFQFGKLPHKQGSVDEGPGDFEVHYVPQIAQIRIIQRVHHIQRSHAVRLAPGELPQPHFNIEIA
jgi:hypothetical protein